jgi:hypothetical protein
MDCVAASYAIAAPLRADGCPAPGADPLPATARMPNTAPRAAPMTTTTPMPTTGRDQREAGTSLLMVVRRIWDVAGSQSRHLRRLEPRMTDTTSPPKNPDRLELEQLTALQPGLARLMPEIGARFWKAFYAAQAANWPLASWQLREMRKLLRLCEVTRPKYTDDIEEWITDDLDPLMAALDAHDFVAFEKRYHESVDFANELHRRWQKEWIVWKLPDTLPPDLDLTPRG